MRDSLLLSVLMPVYNEASRTLPLATSAGRSISIRSPSLLV